MLMGIKFQARPSPIQTNTLSEWMGAAKFVYNAKCDEDRYLRTFAKKYLPVKTFPRPDATYAQYKNVELSPFLASCPSQILRNSVSNWYFSYQQFFKQKDRGRPKRKKYGKGMTLHLTRELFYFEETIEGLQLFIGTKRNNIGFLKVNWHDKEWLKYGYPKSLRIKKLPCGKFTVSFCYGEEEDKNAEKNDRVEWFNYLKENKPPKELEKIVLGVDRGINVVVATDEENIHFKDKATQGLKKWKKRLKKQQIRFAKQKKRKSNRRHKKKIKIAKIHQKISNIRDNECHHISKSLVEKKQKVFILEDLKIKNLLHIPQVPSCNSSYRHLFFLLTLLHHLH